MNTKTIVAASSLVLVVGVSLLSIAMFQAGANSKDREWRRTLGIGDQMGAESVAKILDQVMRENPPEPPAEAVSQEAVDLAKAWKRIR